MYSRMGGLSTSLFALVPPWPGPSNTGVPPGTSLTTIVGDMSTTSVGQVVNALNITGTLFVLHSGVVISNCKIGQMFVESDHVIVKDSTFIGIGPTNGNSGITVASPLELGSGPAGPPAADSVTILRCDISGVENGIWFETSNSIVQDCYIHDLSGVATAHIDGIQVPQDPVAKSNNTIRHNNFDLSLGTVSSCCQFDNALNFIIDHNRFSGGSNELYLLTRNGGTTQFCTIINNIFVINPFGGYIDEQVVTGLNSYSGNIMGATS